MRARALLVGTAITALSLIAAAPAGAQLPGLPVLPIPSNPLEDPNQFIGSGAAPKPLHAPNVPRHPFMAPNGMSNLHDDAYQTDTYTWSGPLGPDIKVSSAFFARECGSITFDRFGRLESVCVGLDRPVLALLDPKTLEVLAEMDLPPRSVGGGNPFTDFSGGGYFYLDNQDRAVLPTATRHVLVVGQTGGTSNPGFATVRDHDLTGSVPSGDAIISALPDWKGRIWFATKKGVVGKIGRGGAIRSVDLGEPIGNSFAVDRSGGVFIVTDAAMYRFDARHGALTVTWRETYDNVGSAKPGQTEAGSGTTPTLMGRRWVAITDNADPMKIVVLKRRKHVRHGRLVCSQPVFDRGAGSTDQSLIGAGRRIVVENNYGYTGPSSTENGSSTTPGLERVDIDRDRHGCHTVWHSDESAPSVVPKLSLANGLVYTYTKPGGNRNDPWYLTALDARTGRTVWKRVSGYGLGHNNNFAPVTLAPDGTAYVGALGGLIRFADAR
jgi:outer membrane protein assembly factor BamB